jgi:hypothetical protein
MKENDKSTVYIFNPNHSQNEIFFGSQQAETPPTKTMEGETM